jgi:hypothetical protein
MDSSLSTSPRDLDLGRIPFHRVITAAELCGIQQDAKNFDVVLGSDPGDKDSDDEKQDAANERMHEREDRAT